MRSTILSLAVLGLTFASPLAAQGQPDPAALVAAQRQAMGPLARMDGVWRGPAWSVTQAGRRELTQTERIGTFLDGSVRVIEGRGYNADGSVGFNALGIISFHADTNSYTISSWAQGRGGVFPFRPTADGYEWEVPAGPGMTIRYSATVTADTLREVGHLVRGDAPPVQIFEMNLRRVGTTDWPGAGAVPMR
ncbi:DUF1579 domain-containing protein [Allosphingosinicella sp.]|uniref:DUF1579 domain-containing protein n=1 Tax=Allosphingosinicella sp. TaxID=2823234 RepID=UPI0037832DA3